MFFLHFHILYSDQSQKSVARHQDLPLRVSQDMIGEESAYDIYSVIESLQCSALQYSCFLFLIFSIRLCCVRLSGGGIQRS